MSRLALVIALAGCGRVGFDALADGGAVDTSVDTSVVDAAAACVVDTFDTTPGQWMITASTWEIGGAGPDATSAYRAAGTGAQDIVHPALASVTSVNVAIDYRIDDMVAGDFKIMMLAPGWTSRADAHYEIGLFPPSGDDPNDEIALVANARTILASRATSAAVSAWHHVEFSFAIDHSMSVTLDGAPYLSSPADTRLAGPFDLMIHFWNAGAIDNVRVDCTR
jgi:hypothetical protein